MTQNFFVLTKVDTDIVHRISLDKAMSDQLIGIFNEQLINFDNKYPSESEIDFAQNWTAGLDTDESFIVNNFEDISGIVKSVTELNDCGILGLGDITKIKGIYTGIETPTTITVLIQSFNRSRAITNGKFSILKSGNTFSRFDDEIIILDNKLAGTFTVNKATPTIGKLKFHSFYDIRQLFDMSEYYKEASNEQVETFLNNSFFNIDNFNRSNSDSSWVKKKVGMIMQDEVLQNNSIDKIMEACAKRKIDVHLVNGRIQLSNDKTEFKRFLKLLSEDYFDGEFSGTTYSASSKIKVKTT